MRQPISIHCRGAIDFCAVNVDLNAQKVFRLDDGIYQEMIYLRDQSNITIKGNPGDNTAVNVQYDNSNDINGGIGGGTNIDQFARWEQLYLLLVVVRL